MTVYDVYVKVLIECVEFDRAAMCPRTNSLATYGIIVNVQNIFGIVMTVRFWVR